MAKHFHSIYTIWMQEIEDAFEYASLMEILNAGIDYLNLRDVYSVEEDSYQDSRPCESDHE